MVGWKKPWFGVRPEFTSAGPHTCSVTVGTGFLLEPLFQAEEWGFTVRTLCHVIRGDGSGVRLPAFKSLVYCTGSQPR